MQSNQYTFKITGTSMDNGRKGSMSPGDILKCRKVNKSEIEEGKLYVIQTKDAIASCMVSLLYGKYATLSFYNRENCDITIDEISDVYKVESLKMQEMECYNGESSGYFEE